LYFFFVLPLLFGLYLFLFLLHHFCFRPQRLVGVSESMKMFHGRGDAFNFGVAPHPTSVGAAAAVGVNTPRPRSARQRK
jgi:hypothetical protein